MNRPAAVAVWMLRIAVFFGQFLPFPVGASENLVFQTKLEPEENKCLAELIRASNWWRYTPQFADELLRIAKVARANLNGKKQAAYLYLFEDGGWCGSAGCPMLIGERQADGRCGLLYDGNGIGRVTVLRSREHGYRRLYLPCEVRFDGRHYQQIRPGCPTVDVQR